MKTDLQNVAPTITDKVVEFFSPAAGLERRKARMFLALAGGYTSGRRDRRRVGRDCLFRQAGIDTGFVIGAT